MRLAFLVAGIGISALLAGEGLQLGKKEEKALLEEAAGRYGKAWRLYLEAFKDSLGKADKRALAEAEVYLHRAKSLFEQQPRCDFAVLAKELDALKGQVKEPLLAAFLRLYLAEALLKCGRPQDAQSALAGLGFVRHWFVIGPFDNERGSGFGEKFGPEKGLEFNAEYQGKRRSVRWRNIALTSPLPILDFDAIMRPNDQVLAYALCIIHSEKEQPAALRFGSDEGFKLFVNAKEVLSRDCHRDFFWDQEAVAVLLRKGYNAILLKVAEDKGDWCLALRITAPDGSPLKGIKFVTSLSDAAKVKIEPFKEAKFDVAVGAKKVLEEAAKKNDLRANFHLGYLHIAYHWQDASLHFDRRYLMNVHKAVPKNPIVAYWVSETYLPRAAEMETEKMENQRKEFLLKALKNKPDYVEVLCELGRYYLERLRMWRRAQEYVERALAVNPRYAPALKLQMDIYEARNFRAEKEAALIKVAEGKVADALLDDVLMLLDERGRVKREEELLKDIWQRNTEYPGLLDRYVTFLREQGRDEEALKLLDAAIAAKPFNITPRTRKAEILYSDDRFEAAAKAYEAILDFCPEDRDTLLAYAKTLLRLSLERGEKKDGPTYQKALDVLRRLLRVDPTNAWVKRYLEFVGKKRRLLEEMERFADTVRLENGVYIINDHYFKDGKVGEKKLEVAVKDLEAAAKKENVPFVCVFYRLLLEITPRATSSEHHYIVLRVMNERGAEMLASLYCGAMAVGWGMDVKVKQAKVIRRDGTVEEGKVSYGSVSFSNLRPGDTLVVSFRADERATEQSKFFGDYYGQIISLNPTGRLRRFFFSVASDLMPVKFSKLVLVLPKENVRKIHIYAKGVKEKATEETGVDEKTRVLVWRLKDLPLMTSEAYMPPMEQVTPNIQVSTFYDWKKFGKWFWGLIRKQFEGSEKLKAKVAELIKGKKSELEKIWAIARFVTEKIRYEEAASFDIHGWKPYKAAQIFERGNGDCKDKAILFCTMMREAQLKAYMVLVKSQVEGRGKPDLTLPLIRHFNHAIAYVPATKEHPELWLDLTANRYTLTEMPPEWDRGATVFVVGDDIAQLKTIPTTSPNTTQRLEATVLVAQDGKATLHFKATLHGISSWLLRRMMEEKGRRKERIENSLNEKIANFHLKDLKLPNLKDVLSTPFVWEIKGEATDFVAKTAEGYGIKPLPLSRKWSDELTGLQTRKLPLALPAAIPRAENSQLQPIPYLCVPGTCAERWLYRFKGFKIKSLPENLSVETPFVSASIKFNKKSETEVEVTRKVTFKTNWVPLEGYAQLRQALAKLDRHLRYFIILKKAK